VNKANNSSFSLFSLFNRSLELSDNLISKSSQNCVSLASPSQILILLRKSALLLALFASL